MRIGDILKNSIAINELNGSDSRKNEMSYVLLGACQDENKIYAVRSVVSKLLNDVTDIDIWQLGAVKGKKTETPNSALKRGAAVTEQSSLISSGSPTISITDFLHIVKDIALINEVFSEDVARIGWAVSNAESGYLIRTQTGEIDYSYHYKNADGTPSPKVMLEKSIGDKKFIVAECVPDSVAKKIHIISARITKSGNGQVLNMKPYDSPQPTSRTLLDGITTINSITDSDKNVNKKLKEPLKRRKNTRSAFCAVGRDFRSEDQSEYV